eukprot:2443016-Alexandrium_andersonii.AAC.1
MRTRLTRKECTAPHAPRPPVHERAAAGAAAQSELSVDGAESTCCADQSEAARMKVHRSERVTKTESVPPRTH